MIGAPATSISGNGAPRVLSSTRPGEVFHSGAGLKKNRLTRTRRSNGRKSERTSFCIVDSQCVKNTDSEPSPNKGSINADSGKEVSGIKRHIAVDTQGLPHAIHTTSLSTASP